MADLTRPGWVRERGRRGQIILIAAFALAVTFVTLAIVVNSAIFTENLATRGETGGSHDALLLRHEVEQAVSHSLGAVNVHNTSDLDAGADGAVTDLDHALTRQHAADGTIVTVEPDPGATEYGSRVSQNESGGRELTSNSADEDWTVMYGVRRPTHASDPGNGTRNFVMNVSEVPSAADPFVLRAENYTDHTASAPEWRMELHGDLDDTVSDNELTVRVDTPLGDSTCTVEIERTYATVDVSGGTVAGQPCSALRNGGFDGRFGHGAGRKYNVTFDNGDAVTGNYSLVTANHTAATIDAPNLNDTVDANPRRDSPYVTEAIYKLSVRYTYQSPRVEYETDVRVAPGEPS